MNYLLIILFCSVSLAQDLYPLLPQYAMETRVPNLVFKSSDFNPKDEYFVEYFSPREAKSFEVKIENGRLYQNGQRYKTDFTRSFVRSIFVLDQQDRLLICDCDRTNLFHHSSLVRGAPVKSAGEMLIVDGVIVSLNNQSEHYRPGAESLSYLLEKLEQNGYQYVSRAKVSSELVKPAEISYWKKRPKILPFWENLFLGLL